MSSSSQSMFWKPCPSIYPQPTLFAILGIFNFVTFSSSYFFPSSPTEACLRRKRRNAFPWLQTPSHVQVSPQHFTNQFVDMEEADINTTRKRNWKDWLGMGSTVKYTLLDEERKSIKLPVPLLLFGVFFAAIVAAVLLLPKGGSSGSGSFQYPSVSANGIDGSIEKFTRDVPPKQIHSHNDYWRPEPFFTAYKHGAISIEADVWHFPEQFIIESSIKTILKPKEVYVGHSLHFLRENLTLQKMYLRPLYLLLAEANQRELFANGTIAHLPGEADIKGVFFNDPFQQLNLWFDIKTYPEDTYEQLKPLLQPFIDRDWLTYYDTEKKELVERPVVITLTGNLPTETVKKEKKRYVFLDAPLSSFTEEADEKALQEHAELSVIASGSLESLLGEEENNKAKTKSFSESQLKTIKGYFDLAHKYKLKTRIWGAVLWPKRVRDHQNRELFEIGLDLINTDFVEEVAQQF